VWLKDGSALHDHLAKGYTLLRFDNDRVDMSSMISEFQKSGVPFEVLTLDDTHAVEVYEGYELFLLRPDLHIVWRGNDAPQDLEWLVAVALGKKLPPGLNN
jgi:hypothetical protein